MYKIEFIVENEVVSLTLPKEETKEYFSSGEISEGYVENEAGFYKITKV